MRCYYTFKELTNPDNEGWSKLFYDWIREYNYDQYTSELFNYVETKFADANIVYVDVCGDTAPTIQDLKDNPELKSIVKEFMRNIRVWLDLSKVKYRTIIKLYQDNENALMNKLTSRATNQFNDTPQTTTAGLDSDNYASTYSVNTTETDPATTIQKLSEIRALWVNVYEEWVEEFAKKFVL